MNLTGWQHIRSITIKHFFYNINKNLEYVVKVSIIYSMLKAIKYGKFKNMKKSNETITPSNTIHKNKLKMD